MEKLKFRHSLEDGHNNRCCSVHLVFGDKNLGDLTYSTSIKVDAIDGNDTDTGKLVTQVTLYTEKVHGVDITKRAAEMIADALGFFASMSYCDISKGHQLNADRLLTNAEVAMVIATLYDLQANS